MKLLSILTSSLLMTLATLQAAPGKHLFILSGQSNMVGMNPATSFTPAVEKAFGKDQVIVVKDAQSGCPIRRWVKDWKPADDSKMKVKPGELGDLYTRLMGHVQPAIEGQQIASVTFIWMQGERDAKEGHGEVYAKSFTRLISQLKSDLKRDDVAFVIGRISDHGIKNGVKIPDWPTVREAQVQLAESDPFGAWVDTDDFNGGKDGLHYGGDGYRQLGQRFAEEAIRLIEKRRKPAN